MKGKLAIVRTNLLKLFIQLPVFRRYSRWWYKKLGVSVSEGARISNTITFVGNYSNLSVAKNAEINVGCFLLAKDIIEIGENSTLAYQVTILTSANPNGPYNKLARIYPKMNAPVFIGDNSWIGARATILPGVTIGDFCVVAAGAVVTKDVSDYTVVAGIPAKVIRKLNPSDFE